MYIATFSSGIVRNLLFKIGSRYPSLRQKKINKIFPLLPFRYSITFRQFFPYKSKSFVACLTRFGLLLKVNVYEFYTFKFHKKSKIINHLSKAQSAYRNCWSSINFHRATFSVTRKGFSTISSGGISDQLVFSIVPEVEMCLIRKDEFEISIP